MSSLTPPVPSVPPQAGPQPPGHTARGSAGRTGRRAAQQARRFGRLGLGLLLTVVSLAEGAAQAASPTGDRCQANPACRSHSEKGVAFSEKKLYSLALNEFQAAYDIEPAPLLLLNIGRSLHRLERYQEALDRFSKYRKSVAQIDAETEQTLRRYEIESLTALSMANQPEPPPAPLIVEPDRWPPKLTLALFGIGAGMLAIGIGLGAGAVSAASDLSAPSNNFRPFSTLEQSIERRGIQLERAGQAVDILGLITLGGAGASLATWFLLRPGKSSVASSGRHWARLRPSTAPSADSAVRLGGF